MYDSFAHRRFSRTPVLGFSVGLCATLALFGCGPERTSQLDDATEDRASHRVDPRPDTAEVPGDAADPDDDPRPTILFLGNSLTAGLGVDPAEAFPALIQTKIDQADLELQVVNAGVSGETTGGGLSRIDWLLEREITTLVLELGANDALRGAPPEVVEENLQAIIDRARARHPRVRIVLAGMQAPPNMGRIYADAFREIFPRLASKNGAALIPFLLEGVAADRRLNQADGIHPTAEGHAIMAETVWEVLEPVLAGLSG